MRQMSAYIDLNTLTAGNQNQKLTFTDLSDLKQQLIENPMFVQGDLDDFRRAADNVRLAQLGAILCASNIRDSWEPSSASLIGVNGDGCTSNNKTFWDDFTSHGRESGRAALFVPTLPSIPACEAAITLKITGPVRYIASSNRELIIQHLQDTFLSDESIKNIMVAEIKQDGATFELYDRTLLASCADSQNQS